VDVRIETTPEGAFVLRDGIELGQAPLKLSVRRGDVLQLAFRAPRFQPLTKSVVVTDNSSVAVVLAQVPEAQPLVIRTSPKVTPSAARPKPKASPTASPATNHGASYEERIMNPTWGK